MYIIWLEMKKALLSPAFLILLLLMTGYNLFLIISESHNKDELKIVNEIIETYGPTFNNEILKKMEEDTEQLTKELGGTSTYIKEMTDEKYSNTSLTEQQQIDHLHLLNVYVQSAKGLEEQYKAIDIGEIKEGFLKEEKMSPWLEKIISNEFDNLQERYNEIVATNEYKQWFFLGNYRMHSLLFRSYMKTLAFEGVFLIVLLTALIRNYEFEHRTQLVTYAAKKGRSLVLYKGIASLLCSLIVIAFLFGVTLATYFIVYDYSQIWQIPITSVFNWEANLPYITWWEIPMWKFLLLAIGVLTIVLIIIMLLTFTISIFIKNSYFTWILCVLLLVAMFVVPSYFQNNSILWPMHFNITLLILNPHEYFDSLSMSFMMMKYHELWTIILWLFIGSILSMSAIRSFKRKDVV